MVNLVGQSLERRARRRELLLSKAIDLAFARRETLLRLAESTGAAVTITDDVSKAAAYYAELQHLLDRGELSLQFREREAESKARLDASDRRSRGGAG